MITLMTVIMCDNDYDGELMMIMMMMMMTAMSIMTATTTICSLNNLKARSVIVRSNEGDDDEYDDDGVIK
jgi:hypothetical protein